jgi:hypothetical protein
LISGDLEDLADLVREPRGDERDDRADHRDDAHEQERVLRQPLTLFAIQALICECEQSCQFDSPPNVR